MSEKIANGKTNKIWGQKGKGEFNDNPTISAKNERDCRGIEYQSRRTAGNVDQGLGRTAIYRSLGGILSLLRGIVSKGLNYMDAHSERLEERLTESKRAKADFLEQATALEKEIVRLLEQAEKLPEDPNEEK